MLVKLSLSFLAGVTVPAISIYLTGGSNRFMFLFGFILALFIILIPTFINLRRVALFLWALEYSYRSFKVGMTHGMKEAPNELGRRAEDNKPVNPFAGDVESALINLGVRKIKAKRVVEEAGRMKIFGSFEEMFNETLQIAKAGGA